MTNSFWSTQPVNIKKTDDEENKSKSNKPDEAINGSIKSIEEGPITTEISYRDHPFELPEGLCFKTLSIENLNDITELLYSSYVSNINDDFKLIYKKEFLSWEFNNPKNGDNLMLGITQIDSKKLVGFVFAGIHELFVNGKNFTAVSVNYLCLVHELRKSGLAPILIKEITRRANLKGIYQAIFTGGMSLNFKVASPEYFHRVINLEKLKETGFCDDDFDKQIPASCLAFNFTLRPETSLLEEVDDIKMAHKIYTEKSSKYRIHESMTFNEFLYNIKNVADVNYNLINKKDGVVTSFGSFFVLYSLSKNTNKMIKTAYLGYYGGEKEIEMVIDLICIAKDIGCDVFNVTGACNNDRFIDKLGFLIGDAKLNFYLFNWRCNEMKENDIFFTLH